MAQQSHIEWTNATWNPVTGCTEISIGCANCYAKRMAKRLKAMGNPRYTNGFRVTEHPDLLELPRRWRKPRFIFVNSMSDLFHDDVNKEFIIKVFGTMNACPQHVFQILTKRPERAAILCDQLIWTPNIWFGTTIEHRDTLARIQSLALVPAHVRFVSAEPLLSSLDGIDLSHVDWMIVGGESGPGARPMKPRWARELRDTCQTNHVAFFFKQWGGTNKKRTGRILDGKNWNQMPQSGSRLWGGKDHNERLEPALAS